MPSFYSRLFITEVMVDDIKNEDLEDILSEYIKPVTMDDEIFETLDLDKDLEMFQGYMPYKDNEIPITLDVNKGDKAT